MVAGEWWWLAGAADVVKWRRLRGESPVQKRVREEAGSGWLWFLAPGAGEAWWHRWE